MGCECTGLQHKTAPRKTVHGFYNVKNLADLDEKSWSGDTFMKPRKTTQTTSIDWFAFGAVLFGTWAAVNTFLSMARYGVEQGVYWWFCNLALIGTAWGLARKHRGWLLGFLSIACFTQSFWVLDNLSRLFLGQNVFGLVEFLYRPGLPMDEFLLAHYHYFTIPVCLFALYYLPSKQKSNALRLVTIFNPLIFGVSYFVFPAAQNINCIHESCMPALQNWTGPVYSFTFWAVIFAAHILCCLGFESFYAKLKRNPPRAHRLSQAFAGFVVAAIGLSAWDVQYRMTLPSLTCAEATENSEVRIGCGYTLDHSDGNMNFVYRIKNKSSAGLVCSTKAKTQFTEFALSENIGLAPGESRNVRMVLPYPDVSVHVTLSADCQATGERAITSTPERAVRGRDAR